MLREKVTLPNPLLLQFNKCMELSAVCIELRSVLKDDLFAEVEKCRNSRYAKWRLIRRYVDISICRDCFNWKRLCVCMCMCAYEVVELNDWSEVNWIELNWMIKVLKEGCRVVVKSRIIKVGVRFDWMHEWPRRMDGWNKCKCKCKCNMSKWFPIFWFWGSEVLKFWCSELSGRKPDNERSKQIDLPRSATLRYIFSLFNSLFPLLIDFYCRCMVRVFLFLRIQLFRWCK